MEDIKKIVGNNIKTFIESRERKNSWVIERTGIGKNAYYDMLNGKGNIDEHITKLNTLFGIKDPMYFYKTDYDYNKPRVIFNRKEIALKLVGDKNNRELNDGIEVFLELAELIDVLKTGQE
ncbi:TPA: hypothetical protein ROY42_005626 [Bacillus thuringiensis]|nr:hypothetical protein [Bacillus thuringiensis]